MRHYAIAGEHGFERMSRVAPAALVAVSLLFDRVCILCYANSCLGQRDAWPSEVMSRLVVIDGARVDAHLGVEEMPHHHKAAQTYAFVLREQLSAVESVLILEADWTIPSSLATSLDSSAIRTWLHSEPWLALRLGYNPMPGLWSENGTSRCHPACTCTRSRAVPAAPICTVFADLRKPREQYCDIRSFVGAAFHRRSLEPLLGFARAVSLNFTAVPEDRLPNVEMAPIDLWLPATFSRVDYLVPAIIVQSGSKRVEHTSNIARFLHACEGWHPPP